jgi:hypothetical protein
LLRCDEERRFCLGKPPPQLLLDFNNVDLAGGDKRYSAGK